LTSDPSFRPSSPARSLARGRAIEAYAEPAFDKERAQAAGERIRELRKGVTLGGLTIRELIDEGRS